MDVKNGTRSLTEACFDAFLMWRCEDEKIIYYPVLSLEEIPDKPFNFFVRAEFVSPSGIKFKGYLVSVTRYYCMGLYYYNKEYMFNKNMFKECCSRTTEIVTLINSPKIKRISDIFPLKYRTNINMPDIRELDGAFDAFERARANGVQFDDQVIE